METVMKQRALSDNVVEFPLTAEIDEPRLLKRDGAHC